MVKRFSKFLKYKNKLNNKFSRNRKPFKKQEQPITPTCFECGKIGHIKPECPFLNLK